MGFVTCSWTFYAACAGSSGGSSAPLTLSELVQDETSATTVPEARTAIQQVANFVGYSDNESYMATVQDGLVDDLAQQTAWANTGVPSGVTFGPFMDGMFSDLQIGQTSANAITELNKECEGAQANPSTPSRNLLLALSIRSPGDPTVHQPITASTTLPLPLAQPLAIWMIDTYGPGPIPSPDYQAKNSCYELCRGKFALATMNNRENLEAFRQIEFIEIHINGMTPAQRKVDSDESMTAEQFVAELSSHGILLVSSEPLSAEASR